MPSLVRGTPLAARSIPRSGDEDGKTSLVRRGVSRSHRVFGAPRGLRCHPPEGIFGRKGKLLKRFLRISTLAAVIAAASTAVFVASASANYGGAVDITCTGATYHLTLFPGGSQDVLETVFVDGAVAAQSTVTFTGPATDSTLAFTVPADGKSHTVEANAYSLTNSTPVFGLPGITTVTCGSTPPPPPPGVCTYTKGFYRNHAATTAAVIGGMGGTIQVGSTALTAAQAQAILNATPGTPGNVTFTSNLLLNLVQQLLAGELNGARGSTVSPDVQAAIAAANAGVTATIAGGKIALAAAASLDQSGVEAKIESFNSASDCG